MTHPGSFGIFDSFRLLSIERAWIPKNVVRHYMLLVRSRYDTVIAAGEGHVRVLNEFNSSELI